MSQRRLYLDDAPGQRRGVVTLDGLPERLLIERDDDIAVQQPQARVAARVRRMERALQSAFLDLGEGPDAILPLNEAARSVTEGAWLQIEIVSPARGEKGAVARLLGACDGPGRLLQAAPGLETRLQSFAPGAAIIGGAAARDAADIAEAVALKIQHPLAGGARMFIEQTQALTAIDVDLASTGGDARKAAVRANGEAIATAARLLRLKGLGGLVAIDLAGRGHHGATLAAVAKTAFAPDGAGVSIGPISRFGVLELSVPRTVTPISERLLAPDGGSSSMTVALGLLRAIERAAGPGQRVEAACAPEVAEIAARFVPMLSARIGPRFIIRSEAFKDRTSIEVTTL